MKMNIALLAGGNSSEREIALQSAAQIERSLDKSRYNVLVIDIHGRQWVYRASETKSYPFDKNDFSLEINGRRIAFDYALIMIHGTPGEDGRLQGYLEMMGIPYSSCDIVSSVITFDKHCCKKVLAGQGLNLAREVFIRRGEAFDSERIVAELGLPLFVKPNASGSSCGITKVHCAEQIAEAVEKAFGESDAVLIEECISGREIACGIYMDGGKPVLLPVTEIVSHREFFDYEAKYTPGVSEEITPADLPAEWIETLHAMTLEAYRACGCRGIVRVDFIVTPQGRPYLIELNTIPGMSAGSIVPKQAAAAGITLGELFDRVIEETLRR